MLFVLSPNETQRMEDDLLRAARSSRDGDFRAFEELVRLHQRRILADCRCLTRDPNNSEDLAQEVFVKAFFGLQAFEGRSSFRHWLQRIKVHHCLNHLQKRDGKEALSIDEEAAEANQVLRVQPVAQRKLEEMEERERVEFILNSMPQTLRIPLVMRDMDELTYEEIANSLSIGLSAVKMRIKRAREYFRRTYEDETGLTPGQSAT